MDHIYIAESGDGFVKVGKSDDPQNRMRQIELSTGLKITKWKSFECKGNGFVYEKIAHEKLFDKSLFGEWFTCDFESACKVCEEVSNDKSIKNKRKSMAFLNLEIPNNKRDILKREAKNKGMKFYPFLSKELEKIADKLEKKNENV